MARICIVDDNEIQLEVIRDILLTAGHDVTASTEASSLFEDGSLYQSDLLITDIFMPDTEGIEIISKVRKSRPGIRIIAMSGGSTRMNYDPLKMARAMGADRTLSKPFETKLLLTAVAETLATGA